METLKDEQDNLEALSDPFYAKIRDSGDGNSVEITLDKKWVTVHGYKIGNLIKCWARKVKEE